MRSTHPRITAVYLLCLSILTRHIFAFTTPTISNRNNIHHTLPASFLQLAQATATTSEVQANETPFDILKNAQVFNPSSNNAPCTALEGLTNNSSGNANNPAAFLRNIFDNVSDNEYLLVIVMSQLGDFDSAEYAEFLSAVKDELKENKVALRIIGLGDAGAAKRFANFAGLGLDTIRVDPDGSIHRALNLHRGPDWDVPSFLPQNLLEWFADYCGAKENGDGGRDAKAITRAWLNYMAMCAGIAAPDTLPEIIRGYLGDKTAPERLRADDIVTVPSLGGQEEEPFIVIKGITDVKLGPIEYQSLWKNEKGYQRPAELASTRLRVMVEVLTNFDEYVPDQRFLDLRGATYLFKQETSELVYEHVDTGVLSYSKTMKRPLSFLEPYIGKKARNPLGLGDPQEK